MHGLRAQVRGGWAEIRNSKFEIRNFDTDEWAWTTAHTRLRVTTINETGQLALLWA